MNTSATSRRETQIVAQCERVQTKLDIILHHNIIIVT